MPDAARLRPLDPPHKGLRNALGVLSLQAGRTEFSDPVAVADLQATAAGVWALLRDHARLEDEFIFARLDRAVPGASAPAAEQHPELDATVDELEEMLAGLDGTQSNDEGHRFVLALVDFQARYLAHLVLEETVIEPLLLEHVTDEEFAADQQAVLEGADPATLMLWFRYIVPARRPADTRPIMANFVANAPPPAVEAVRSMLAEVLDEPTFRAVFAED